MPVVDVVAVELAVGEPVAVAVSLPPAPPSSLDALNFPMMKSTATSV